MTLDLNTHAHQNTHTHTHTHTHATHKFIHPSIHAHSLSVVTRTAHVVFEVLPLNLPAEIPNVDLLACYKFSTVSVLADLLHKVTM